MAARARLRNGGDGMGEPTNLYSTKHPGHAEPDRYLDDEGRCTFCGRSYWEEEAEQFQRQLAAALEALEEAKRARC